MTSIKSNKESLPDNIRSLSIDRFNIAEAGTTSEGALKLSSKFEYTVDNGANWTTVSTLPLALPKYISAVSFRNLTLSTYEESDEQKISAKFEYQLNNSTDYTTISTSTPAVISSGSDVTDLSLDIGEIDNKEVLSVGLSVNNAILSDFVYTSAFGGITGNYVSAIQSMNFGVGEDASNTPIISLALNYVDGSTPTSLSSISATLTGSY